MSLSEMTCKLDQLVHAHRGVDQPTFSWRKCFRSFNSRYVRLDSTGVEKGFMIFFTATACPVN